MRKLWVWALALAILLRILLLVPIVMGPLWYDENYTLVLTRLPVWSIVQATAGDVHPPLFYLLEKLLTFNAPLPWMVRIPPLLFSIATLVVLWCALCPVILSTQSDSENRSDFAIFVLYAIIPTSSFYAMEARMYSWLTMLLLLAYLMIVSRRPVWLGVLAAALLWSHNYGMFYVASLGVCVLIWRKDGWQKQILALALAGLSFVPWLFVLLRQMATISGSYWIIQFTWPAALFEFYKSWFIDSGLKANIPALVAFWGCLFFALPLVRWSHSRMSFAALAFGPFVLSVIASVVIQPMVLYRALVPCVPFLLLLIVDVLFASRKSSLLTLAALAPIMVVLTVRMIAPNAGLRGVNDIAVKQTIAYIDAHWQPGDTVLHMGAGSWIDSISYAAHPEGHAMTLPCGPVRGTLSPETRRAMGVVTLADAPAGRYWLITEGSPMTPACELDQTAELTRGNAPLWCIVDNELQRSCVYLVEDRP